MATEHYVFDISQITLQYYIPYNILDKLIVENGTIEFRENEYIDIYVDIYRMYRRVFTGIDITNSKPYPFITGLLNLAAHYRNYFARYHCMGTRIYLVNSWPGIVYCNENNFSKYWERFNQELELTQTLCQLIPDVYFINSFARFTIFTYNNIINDNNVSQVLLITRDIYSYNIPVNLRMRCMLINPATTRDNICEITSNNAIYRWISKGRTSRTAAPLIKSINSGLLSYFMVANGIKGELTCKIKITKFLKMVTGAIKRGYLINAYSSNPETVYRALDVDSAPRIKYKLKGYKPEKIPLDYRLNISNYMTLEEFKTRFYFVDLKYQQLLYIRDPRAHDMSWKINLDDSQLLIKMNDKYFADNPIDVIGLLYAWN